jgi:hypothetical protein
VVARHQPVAEVASDLIEVDPCDHGARPPAVRLDLERERRDLTSVDHQLVERDRRRGLADEGTVADQLEVGLTGDGTATDEASDGRPLDGVELDPDPFIALHLDVPAAVIPPHVQPRATRPLTTVPSRRAGSSRWTCRVGGRRGLMSRWSLARRGLA